MSDPWSIDDPDLPVIRVLMDYDCGLSSGVVGGLALRVQRLPIGPDRQEMIRALERTGLVRVIIDTHDGDFVAVGGVEPDEAARVAAREMRSHRRMHNIAPPFPAGLFPLLSCWAYPFGDGGLTGRQLFGQVGGPRPMRVFVAPDVLTMPSDQDLDALVGLLRGPEFEILVWDNGSVSADGGVVPIRFVSRESEFQGAVEWSDGARSISRVVEADDLANLWAMFAPTTYRELPEDEASERVRQEVLVASVAAAGDADLIVTRSPFLLAHPDGFSNRVPHLDPLSGLAMAGLFLRLRDRYLVRPEPDESSTVECDRLSFFRAALHGVLPALGAWRGSPGPQPDEHIEWVDTFEHRGARLLGDRDDLIARLLVQQDANTSYRAMEAFDSCLANVQALLDILASAINRTLAEPLPRPMSIGWSRREFWDRLEAEAHDVTALRNDATFKVASFASALRNTIHAVMIRPARDASQPVSGRTLAEARLRPETISEISETLGYPEEWGLEFEGSTARIDPRRFMGMFLPDFFDLVNRLLTCASTPAAASTSSDQPFGPWLPAAVAHRLALLPTTSRSQSGGSPVSIGPSPRRPIETRFVGDPRATGLTDDQAVVLRLEAIPSDGPQPYQDFNRGDAVAAEDPLFRDRRTFRVREIGASQGTQEVIFRLDLGYS